MGDLRIVEGSAAAGAGGAQLRPADGAEEVVLLHRRFAGGAGVVVLHLAQQRFFFQRALVLLGEGASGSQKKIQRQARDAEDRHQ